ncbi:MAG: M15 family metallopeptidase [Thermoleophilia bacterium]|nr:M15 family metallopeptidase [Thermoleophilia bacterium]
MLVVAAAVLALAAPPFQADVAPIGAELRRTMTGSSWRPGCPVGLRDLRLVAARHWGFDGRVRSGRLVVHRTAAQPIVRVLRRLYERRFPIRRMRLVDAYGGSDFRSIEADNTSAFNCRRVEGTSRWSLHAYGLAIDVNPIENPYVTADGRVFHRASRPYVDRARVRPGMAYPGGTLVEAFRAVGWGWGGTWSGARDYQHFSATGR